MSTRMLAGLAVAGTLAAGCAMSPRAIDTASWTVCDASAPGARCEVRIVANATGKYSCALGRFDVQPDFLQFRGGRPVNVRWTVPDGLQFCSGDGAALKSGFLSSSYSQLYETFGADKDDGSRIAIDIAKACRTFWFWQWGNLGAGTEHEYLIRFRDRDGRQCTIDPWFKNG